MAHPLLSGTDALLIDLDGTLVDSTAAVARAWAGFANRVGLDLDAVMRHAQGRPSSETVADLAPADRRADEAAAVEYSELHDTDGVSALPGAAAALRSGWPMAIVTSCSAALAAARLSAAALPAPAQIVSYDDVRRGKPDPECFLLGARRLGVDCGRCLILEDAPAGVAAGRAAGARVMAVRTTHPDEELRDADAIVDDLTALLD
jgi:mannitol-1-/sugar-/sorbitol-6-phosphatase